MLRIRCPWCGERDEIEFRYGGEAAVARPQDPAASNDEKWRDYLFCRENLKGPHRERWVHAFGCRQWFILDRDTLTHTLGETDPPPEEHEPRE